MAPIEELEPPSLVAYCTYDTDLFLANHHRLVNLGNDFGGEASS